MVQNLCGINNNDNIVDSRDAPDLEAPPKNLLVEPVCTVIGGLWAWTGHGKSPAIVTGCRLVQLVSGVPGSVTTQEQEVSVSAFVFNITCWAAVLHHPDATQAHALL